MVSFAHLPSRWHWFRSEGAVATSWPYRPGVGGGGWADHMPIGGLAVTVFFPTIKTRLAPLTLVLPRRPTVMLEGTTDTPEYRIAGSVNGRSVYVSVDIRSKHPNAAERRAAQVALCSIRFG